MRDENFSFYPISETVLQIKLYITEVVMWR